MRNVFLVGVTIVFVAIATDIIFLESRYFYIPDMIADYATERLFYKMYGIKDGDLIDIQLYGKYEVDTSGLRKANRIAEGTSFTHFFQRRSIRGWRASESYGMPNFHFPFFDSEPEEFRYKYFAVSFGREIAEIRRVGKIHHDEFEVAVTFAEEYQGDVMFLYLMDEIPIWFEMAREYYIMNGSKRVYIGDTSYDLNEFTKQE
ncbi:MAG: hypothetical protein FWG87_10835 [Defluviitaleaceae bacterium]|nr:hypothetical protein [Defluviitaleaceae bacterium]